MASAAAVSISNATSCPRLPWACVRRNQGAELVAAHCRLAAPLLRTAMLPVRADAGESLPSTTS